VPAFAFRGHGFEIHYVDQRKPESYDRQLVDRTPYAFHAGGLGVFHGIVSK
jgi:hypothetical protein